ncbi:MAG: hypothetical protein KJ645_04375, partial [Planctomycetes bacterium]|nr:hypothetical protein [Planctomycetota bacterium]
ITYARTDPLSYGPLQNELFAEMMNQVGGNLMVDFFTSHATPHHWQLLDVDKAFDFIEGHTLEDQNPASLEILADRHAWFYWAEIVQEATDAFSFFKGQANAQQNRLNIDNADRILNLQINCDQAGLHNQKDLLVNCAPPSTAQQTLNLRPVHTAPTYLVNQKGLLYENYSYDARAQLLSIGLDTEETLSAKASFEPYLLTLTVPETATLNEEVEIALTGGEPNDPFILFLSFTQLEMKVGFHHLLLDPYNPSIWLIAKLDIEGSLAFDVTVPDYPELVGMTVYQQFITFDQALKEISNLTATAIQ